MMMVVTVAAMAVVIKRGVNKYAINNTGRIPAGCGFFNVQHHTAQMNLLLRQTVNAAPDWIAAVETAD